VDISWTFMEGCTLCSTTLLCCYGGFLPRTTYETRRVVSHTHSPAQQSPMYVNFLCFADEPWDLGRPLLDALALGFFVETKADKGVVHTKPFPTDTPHTYTLCVRRKNLC